MVYTMTVAVEMGIKADGVTEWKLELTKLGVRYSMPFTDIGRRCRGDEMSSVFDLLSWTGQWYIQMEIPAKDYIYGSKSQER